MQSKRHFHVHIWLIISLTLGICLLPNLGSAQDTGQDAGKQTPAPQGASKDADKKDAEPASPFGLAGTESYIRQIGTSGVLAGNREGIGWGSLYIPSAEVSGIVDRFEGASTTSSGSSTAAVLRTTIVYDHSIGTSRLAFQYSPSMAIAEGQIVANYSNQNTSLDLLLYTRPRWNVKFGDSFRYYYTQQSIGFPYLDVNSVTPGFAVNGFLDGAGRWLSNSSNMTIAYALSRRASIAVIPNYIYSESGTGVNLSRGVSYGGTARWDYRVSERQTVGLEYTGQLLHESGRRTFTSTIGPSDTIYHTISGTAGRQLSATWFVEGSAGVTTSTIAFSLFQTSRQWSPYGRFGLVKQLGRSSVGLKYSRGDTLSYGLISNQYADRVDLTFRSQLGIRLYWSASAGYLRQVGSGGFSGKYATADLQFLLAPRAELFAVFDYYRKYQSASVNNLFTGNHDLYVFGVRWEPGRLQHQDRGQSSPHKMN
jgi:hypothetical protein